MKKIILVVMAAMTMAGAANAWTFNYVTSDKTFDIHLERDDFEACVRSATASLEYLHNKGWPLIKSHTTPNGSFISIIDGGHVTLEVSCTP